MLEINDIPQLIFETNVVNTEIVAEGVIKIGLKPEQEFNFLFWQYVWVEIPELKIKDAKGNRRAFSIFNTKNKDNIIEIVARISESGYKQSLFALKTGDKLRVHGPFGDSFKIDKETPKNLLMIAGGVGIAAMIPILRTIRERSLDQKCLLVYLNSDSKSTPFLKELDDLKKSNKFFDYIVKYTKFDYSDVENSKFVVSGDTQWWIAGTQGMVDFVYEKLEQAGVSKLDMVFENFYPKSKPNLTREMVFKGIETNIFVNALNNSTNHTILTDKEGEIIYANSAAQKTTGYSELEMLGNSPRLWGGLMSSEFYNKLWTI